jgi:hypothetical protein
MKFKFELKSVVHATRGQYIISKTYNKLEEDKIWSEHIVLLTAVNV